MKLLPFSRFTWWKWNKKNPPVLRSWLLIVHLDLKIQYKDAIFVLLTDERCSCSSQNSFRVSFYHMVWKYFIKSDTSVGEKGLKFPKAQELQSKNSLDKTIKTAWNWCFFSLIDLLPTDPTLMFPVWKKENDTQWHTISGQDVIRRLEGNIHASSSKFSEGGEKINCQVFNPVHWLDILQTQMKNNENLLDSSSIFLVIHVTELFSFHSLLNFQV